MHHGYYPQGAPPKSNAQAQIDMIEETLRWAGATSATSVRVAHSMPAAVPVSKLQMQPSARIASVQCHHLAANCLAANFWSDMQPAILRSERGIMAICVA